MHNQSIKEFSKTIKGQYIESNDDYTKGFDATYHLQGGSSDGR